MIQSRAAKYAIRAVCHLAELPRDSWAQAREISEALEIPYHYLSKILQDLTRKGILRSSKGPGGGFRLNCSPKETNLYTVFQAVEGPITGEECMLGLEVCSGESLCPLHQIWSECRLAFLDRMRAISLADVVAAAEQERGKVVRFGSSVAP